VTTVQIRAHAKINLHLGILGRRPDGYHDVETVLQTLALHDTLTCETYDGPFSLRCDRPDVAIDDSNLVWRAAVLLGEAAGLGGLAETRTRITIEKRIPLQAGLGGGSADAAAALFALARLWRVDVDPRTVRAIGSRLGADVPFFFEGGTALGTGRGDELRPLPDFPPCAVLVVMPPFGVPTVDAYRWHDEHRASAANGEVTGEVTGGQARGMIGRWPEQTSSWPAWRSRCRNDFEPVVSARFPEVADTIARLEAAGAELAALSGSGAAMFGLFTREAVAEAAAAGIGRPGWRTIVSRTLDRGSARESGAMR
jgi:4-diphosphocytidyl-2-C-methyl-D-erythritol kinase